MSMTKRWLEDLSVKMGYDGAITTEFLDELNDDPNCLFPPKEEKHQVEDKILKSQFKKA